MKSTRLRRVKSVCCRSILSTIVLGAVGLLVAPCAGAQSTSGPVRGTVSDASGATAVGAPVTLVNTATNVTRGARTNANGEYLFLEVPVGTYELSMVQAGFKKFVR